MGYALMIKNVDFSANKLDTIEFSDNVPCTGITLNKSTISFTSMSARDTLIANIQPTDATDPILWSSSDTNVVTVLNGVITPIGLGQATITASCGNYSATCSVTVDNIVPDYISVTGYSPFKRSSYGSTTTGKKTDQSQDQYVIVANNEPIDSYPIETKTDVDTSPYRFVPIMIPKNAVKLVINSSDDVRTSVLYFNSKEKEQQFNIGPHCLSGRTDETTDQSSRVPTPITYNIPTNLTGLDSCAIAVIIGTHYGMYQDVSNEVSIKFTT